MTTANVNTTHAKTPPPETETGRFRLPDIPPREPDEVTSQTQLTDTGHAHHLAMHLGNLDTTLVTGDRWIIAAPGTFRELARYPDLLVAFDVDPALYKASNGYIISEQGKPPDFVLEVASESTGSIDVNEKRDDYAKLGVLEYWRFDETGQYHGARLAGERLENGVYRPIPIDELTADILQGYSRALNLLLRWDSGALGWHHPTTELHIATFESERARADREWAARMLERQARLREREARLRAEAQVQELEEQLKRLRGE